MFIFLHSSLGEDDICSKILHMCRHAMRSRETELCGVSAHFQNCIKNSHALAQSSRFLPVYGTWQSRLACLYMCVGFCVFQCMHSLILHACARSRRPGRYLLHVAHVPNVRQTQQPKSTTTKKNIRLQGGNVGLYKLVGMYFFIYRTLTRE